MSLKRKREDDSQNISNKLNTIFKSVDSDDLYDFYNYESHNQETDNKLMDEFTNVKYYVELLINNLNITNDLIEYTNLYSELLYNILDIDKIYTRRLYSLNDLSMNNNIQFLNDKYVSGENITIFKQLFTIINKISDFLWTLPISSFRI